MDILPEAQRQVWPLLGFTPALDFVLYGGTAVALHLGHRVSVDFDFFRSEPLDKPQLDTALSGLTDYEAVQDEKNTLVIRAHSPAGAVKISFFGGLGFPRINPPLLTIDRVSLVASREDLLATKLKAVLDRAEAKDYRDIAALLEAGVSLGRGLAGFSQIFGRDPALPLRALGYFKDGDLQTLPDRDRNVLQTARDAVTEIPDLAVLSGSLAAP
ncbi:nucleotidyl transferase AbiEii/AbiGii toxin family protein [Rhodopseudomonas palustris]|uniref:nucleotidyl transferase AbiEii/AbiGii toxin family protein n=1 Tax=Rhodopseudomonas palustris TaxID=1076 RepID=UPI001AECC285|nr:nucleotidyl transferase AbiEii/AbiGii toxin family protein [Rhodopseudomonas palustris]